MDESPRAIFLSYTSQDADAVRRLCASLRAAGLEVWFDQNELRGGDAWDASIRRQIRDCALFLPIISANTEARPEGYFRLEWRLAVERFNLMADDHSFLMPVVIDGTNEATARVPDRFRERQWTRLAGGEPAPAFIEQVKRTLAAASGGMPASVAARAPARPRHTAPTLGHRRWMIASLVMALAVVALAIGLLVSNHRAATQAPPAAAATAARAASTVGAAADPKSIAVLPFVNLTGKAEDAYLADGLQEEILSTLARLSDLRVISRTSTQEFRGFTPNVREIGNRLGVGSVLEGSVRREGNKMRLTVQLIDARNDRHVLAADYDRDVGHILGLQTEVARKIADALSATLSKYERGQLDRVTTNNGDAYELYLRAVAAWFATPGTPIDGDRVRHLLEQALHLDPQYADAAAMLSNICTMMFPNAHASVYAICSRDNYQRALAIDPRLPEAQLARGVYEMYVANDIEQAMPDLEAVARLRPNSPQAHTALGRALRKKGRMDAALAQFQRAWEIDPLSNGGSHHVLTTLAGLRRIPELLAARRLFQQRFPSVAYARFDVARTEGLLQHSLDPFRLALRQYGGTLTPAERNRAEALVAREEGRYLDAIRLVAASPVDDPDDLLFRDMDLGFLYWAAGRNEESQRHFRSAEQRAHAILKREPGATDVLEPLALAQSMLGEHAAALASIDRRRAELPEDRDPVNGPGVSFLRSIILVRAGRAAEGHAEVARLLRVPFGAPVFDDELGNVLLIVKDDRHYDQIIHDPPRL